MLKEGIVLGERYEIISRIGSGGMADVYKAQDHKLNRSVAVKVLKPEFREDTSFVAKFQKEAQAAAMLSHPNVVNVFDVGEDRGLYYIVMELIEGITLKNYIAKKGKLSVKEATSIAIQVSLGLEAAHNRGIIHRDVKPQNIIISTDGKVKLSDFGIAKAINSNSSTNTITANVMGSVHYSSPEQVRGGFADAKSDIYSLGITMYEMVTGRVPFDGDSTVSIAIKHLQEEMVSPSRYTPDLPYSLEQIILKCTQKNPERRYQKVGVLIDDLKHSLIDPQGSFVNIVPLSAHADTAKTAVASDDAYAEAAAGRKSGRAERPSRENRRARNLRDEDEFEDEDDVRFDEDDDDDDGEVSSGLEKAITIGGFLIGAIIILILIAVIGNMAGLFGKKNKNESAATSSTSISSGVEPTATPEPTAAPNSDQVTVPSFLGKTYDDALTEANGLGIGLRQTGTAASEEYPEGQILSQTIPEGTQVDKNSTIEVVVSSGKADVEIPAGLAGLAQSQAEATLTELGLIVKPEMKYDSTIPVGNVISITPAEGSKVAPGTTVTLYISKGEATMQVPNLIGMNVDAAKASLEAMGLTCKIKYGFNAGLAIDDVIAMDPDVGEAVGEGSEITVTVNRRDSGTTDDEEEEEDEDKTDEQPADDGGTASQTTYICDSPLGPPSDYAGGNVKLELVQGGQTTVIYEGPNPWTNGNYNTPIRSNSGETGSIIVYEDGTPIAEYRNNVVFHPEG